MGSYFIFAIVLTVLYVIYYAVNIARDLYGKKESGKTDEEVFDLGLVDATEESISVSENETGFSIGSEKYDTEADSRPASSAGRRCGTRGRDRPCAVRAAEGQGGGTDGRFRPLPV